VADGAKFCSACGQQVAGEEMAASRERSAAVRRSTAGRDWLILAGVLAVVTVVYLVVRQPAESPEQAAGGTSHGGMAADEMGSTMSILNDLPQDYDALVGLGNQFMDERSFPLAAECYKRALAQDDSNPDVQVDYGACLHGMGLPERAVEEFRDVLRDNPEHPIANFNLGVVYYDLQQVDSARVYWQKYLALAPDGPAAASARQLLNKTDG
jgi:tetratricopeptide (TPR) repeat protein